jgi:hypothetical protein
MNTTTITTSPEATDTGQPWVTPRRDRIARIILGICATGALMATASMAASVADAEGTLEVAETWQLAGLPVFAGLFVILAVGPRRTAGLWELVIANKLVLVAAGATYLSGADGADEYVVVDGALVAMLIAAYLLTKGWTAWIKR